MKRCHYIGVVSGIAIVFMENAISAPKATKEELNIVTQRLERLERALDTEAASSANANGVSVTPPMPTAQSTQLPASSSG